MWPGSCLRLVPGQILIISTSGRCALLEPVAFLPPSVNPWEQMQVNCGPRHASDGSGWQCVRECIDPGVCTSASLGGRLCMTLCSVARSQAFRQMPAWQAQG